MSLYRSVVASSSKSSSKFMVPGSMQEYILVPGCTHDALEEQWKVVYGGQRREWSSPSNNNNNNKDTGATDPVATATATETTTTTTKDDGDDATTATDDERNLERGGLVFWDGRVNPGHFCFETKEENDKRLSPISKKIVHTTKQKNITTSNGGGGMMGRVRVGRCCDVSAGWDHTDVDGYDPTTFHYTRLVFGHFHIHADDATGEIRKIRNEQKGEEEQEEEEKIDTRPRHLRPPLKPLLPAPPPPTVPPSMSMTEDQPIIYTSVPSCGDVAAWLMYHRNVSRAFVVTRTTSWFFEKIKVQGHTKDGIECPYHVIEPWIVQLQEHEHEPIAATISPRHTTTVQEGRCDFESIYRQMLQHGFGIFTNHLSFYNNNGTDTATTTAANNSDVEEEERLYKLWRPFDEEKQSKSSG
mmetsp:Transcript_43843/g.106307  ORF Transcript_43843/g.106307 Transcript_43843/m.106307 type:complete len:413 (+) Transcript_43843:32-1270(+)